MCYTQQRRFAQNVRQLQLLFTWTAKKFLAQVERTSRWRTCEATLPREEWLNISHGLTNMLQPKSNVFQHAKLMCLWHMCSGQRAWMEAICRGFKSRALCRGTSCIGVWFGIASFDAIGWETFFLRKGWLLPSDIVGQLSICQLHYGAQLHHRQVQGTYRMIKTTTTTT